jgi:cell pole-organizing protein PopZ
MTQPAKLQEPSMEEILASIRRIIADDDATKSAPQPAEAPKAAAPAARPAPPPPPTRVSPPEPSVADEAPPSMAASDLDGGANADDQASDIFDLTESMAAPPPAPNPAPAPQFRTIDGSFDVSYEEAPEPPSPQMAEPRRSASSETTMAEDSGYFGDARAQLISSATSAAVDSAFNTLAQTVLVQNARTLEDLVREMLRPMLKAWLDDNLPGVVERLVRAEIERVSRGRMG